MRTYGRLFAYGPDGAMLDPQPAGYPQWKIVQTDADGSNDLVWLTTLLQCLKGNTNESPFYSQFGIAAEQSVLQQVLPDYYSARTQQQFAQYFAALTITKTSSRPPIYRVNVILHSGVKIDTSVQVPQ